MSSLDLERVKRERVEDGMEELNGLDNEDILTEEEDRFLEELRNQRYEWYAFQKDLYPQGSGMLKWFDPLFNTFEKSCPIIQAMDFNGVKHYGFSDLERITHTFGESNLIRRLPCGRLFSGEIDKKNVLVKTWDVKMPCVVSLTQSPKKIADELRHLRSSKIRNNPNVVKIIGYHCDKRLAIIYEGTRPKHFLSDIINSDNFGWEDRLKVALDIGNIVKAFHDHGFLHGGIQEDCFMIYEDYVVKNYDFNDYYNYYIRSLYKCGFFHDDSCAPYYSMIGESEIMTAREEVNAFGILLLELVSKYNRPCDLDSWWSNNRLGDLVHESFQVEKQVRSQVTHLIITCFKGQQSGTEEHPKPSMDDVVKILSEVQGPTPAAKRSRLTKNDIAA